MANKNLFRSAAGRLVPKASDVNEAGGVAYARSPKAALAQYAATGCLNSTFYASASEQLERVLSFASAVEPLFVAKTAVYARDRGHMKDVPALLLAWLSVRDGALFARVFDRIVTDARMLRTFVQIMRSGAVGRKSLGSRPKRMVRSWLTSRQGDALFRASVGNDPSLVDVLRMVHPRPATEEQRALFGYVLGHAHDASRLPECVRSLEALRAGASDALPDVPFQFLTSLPLTNREWATIAGRASWQTVRMNLATFARQGVFDVPGATEAIAAKLRDRVAIERARVFPYQLLMAWANATNVPNAVREALADALEVATENVPAVDGKVYVFPDTSGSMSSPVTGWRAGSTTSATCLQVAAMFTASLLRKNPQAEVIPFAEDVKHAGLNPRDSVITNAARLAALGGGGTNCSAPLAELNRKRAMGDLLVYVSDSESWADPRHGRGTATMVEWMTFKQRNPNAKLVCIDLQPSPTTQAVDSADVLNVGGFSDQVFDVVADFRKGGLEGERWVRVVEAMSV